MLKKAKILLIIILICATIPFVIREIDLIKMELLKKEALRIYDKLKNNQSSFDNYKELEVSNNFKIANESVSSKTTGNIFISKDNIIFFIERFNKCAMKTNISEDLILVDKVCPNYKLVKGVINLVVDSGEGLYEKDGSYLYKGSNVTNYATLFNESWRIISYEKDGTIKLISENPISNVENKNIFISQDDLLVKYSRVILSTWYNGSLTLTPETTYYNITNFEEKSDYKSKIGILTLSEYLKTQVDECSIKTDLAICGKNSFIKNTMWLADANESKRYYLYKDGNIYNDSLDGIKDIYPVIIVGSNFEITTGNGTKDDPYMLK